jgi:menaquinone-dependent protoporphyrinogen oxidase
MRVLVVAASKYGATAEIASTIGEVLNTHGCEATVTSPDQVVGAEAYDAVVLGSAVYAGHWLKPAKELVGRLGGTLRSRPVWLFSSGPIGEPPKPEEDPVDVAAIVEATGARDHQVFSGKLDKRRLSFPERAITIALRVPDGDFRDWEAIRSWATAIADDLASAS